MPGIYFEVEVNRTFSGLYREYSKNKRGVKCGCKVLDMSGGYIMFAELKKTKK